MPHTSRLGPAVVGFVRGPGLVGTVFDVPEPLHLLLVRRGIAGGITVIKRVNAPFTAFDEAAEDATVTRVQLRNGKGQVVRDQMFVDRVAGSVEEDRRMHRLDDLDEWILHEIRDP